MDMEEILENHDMSNQNANVEIPIKKILNVKLKKCYQCNYASYYTGHLKTHLKTHSGEKLNKCNQCEYACSDPSA